MNHALDELAAAMARACQAGEMDRAIALAERAGDGGDAHEAVQFWLGLALQATQRHARAAASFRRLTELQPEVSAYWNNLGLALRHADQPEAAERALLTARRLAPADPEAAYNLGLLYVQGKQWQAAREALLDAAGLAPDFLEARLQAARACYVCGDQDSQQALLADAAGWPPQPAGTALDLSALLAAQGELDAALATLAQALPPPEDDAEAWRLRIAARRIACLERGNRLEEARAELAGLPPARFEQLPAQAWQARAEGWGAHAALAMRDGDPAGAAGFYERILDLPLDEESRASAAFGLAAARDRMGRHAEAWQAVEAAHAAQLGIVRAAAPELLAPGASPLPMAERRVGRDAYAGWTRLATPDAGHSPLFVVGFPRSGTTLLEQMLDAHPAFRSMDERAFVHELTERMALAGQRYPQDLGGLGQAEADQLRAVYFRLVAAVLPDLGGRQPVDKNPLNMLYLPMILRLFPAARIVLCLRHPCDVLLSCAMQPFRSPAFMALCSTLERLAAGYVAAFEQWQWHMSVFSPRVLEWRYETVTERFDEQLAALGEFLGLADPAPMADYAAHARRKGYISTPSYAEVTRGIHRRAVGRWEAYRAAFEPVLPMLRPVAERLGYVL